MAEIENTIKRLKNYVEYNGSKALSPKVASEAIQTIRELQNENAELHDSMQTLNIFHQETLEQIPKWHLVADGDLPKPYEYVLVYAKDGYVESDRITTIARIDNIGDWNEINENYFTLEVIAWMELPKFEGVK